MMIRALLVCAVVGLCGFAPAAADEPSPSTPTPTPSASPSPAPIAKITMRVRPAVKGTARYDRVLRRTLGRYSVGNNSYRTVWLRDGKPIAGATSARYTVGVKDVGHRIGVKVTVRHRGLASISRWSHSRRAKHVRDARHTVRYTVDTNGSVSANVSTFRRQVAATLNDPRGWRAAGIVFTEVKAGGSMTVVLAEASRVPTYSSACSATWSCRVGRFVVINETRWKDASPAWNAARGTSLRGYRHMVVNHETGHWLGWGHASCGGAGQTAPVMMQQSKGLAGCTFNPWPKASERDVPRYR